MPDEFSISKLNQVLIEELSIAQHSTVHVAFSGGLDSHVLLHALSQLAADYPFSLNAIHVDHSLQRQSSEWAIHCQAVCDNLEVPLSVKTLNLELVKGESLEAVAREARYSALAEDLPVNAICMTAQHMNDQAETVVLQLLRGSGVHGLAAMPASREFAGGRLLRPLLGFSRQSLLAYAITQGLQWLEDPSNQDLRFDRNFLRHEILPAMRRRWTGMDKSISRSANHAASAAVLLDEMGLSDLKNCQAVCNLFFPPAISYLRADLLKALSSVHQKNALRCWVRMNGLTVPGDERLQSLISLLRESPEKGAVEWKSGAFRLYKSRLWLCNCPDTALPDDLSLQWDPANPLRVNNLQLELRANKAASEGIALSAINSSVLMIRFRQGGEVCRMPGVHGSKSLKKLFQDLAVPPWMRGHWPLVYLHDELIAVVSLWNNPGYLPPADEEGYVFSIHHHFK